MEGLLTVDSDKVITQVLSIDQSQQLSNISCVDDDILSLLNRDLGGVLAYNYPGTKHPSASEITCDRVAKGLLLVCLRHLPILLILNKVKPPEK